MTKEKQTANLVKLLFCLLVVITLSLFLETTALEAANTVPVDKTLTAMQKMAEVSTEKVHSKTVIKEEKHKDIPAEEKQEAIPVIVSEPPAEEQPDYICLNANRGGAASRKETDVLIHLINAEAYGLSYKAKVAVGQVVMNRWTGPYYGDDLLAIMTAPYQFTPIYDGSAYEKNIEPDSIKAAYAVLEGSGVNDLTEDTYYFVNPDFTEDKTIEQKMDFVCEIEGIHFYKPPAK